ncbi:HNH endonuclease [Phycicoccus sp. CSK15P-2]|uniref:HNH endonuclease signature motif containing protein n=1 Tax=Phycicoccus sp. CSK15P-2 TaxID=2807627 RepID=UPI001950C5CA|nr:HNH endonuclease signature motif containing protein [Phycicoccus sp. CSK15P-2]MBM6405365.1 HNH endonuclease [Phycicoccus sp. CSK15P-2]
MTTPAGPQEVLHAAGEARARLASAGPVSGVRGSRAEWAAALGELEALGREVAAAQDVAIVRLAAIEAEVLETGEVVETHRATGHVALDAPGIVSGVLGATAAHAERRVRQAVRLAADGPEGSGTETGLGGLHAAMAAGRLDAFRAGVVAHELEEVPAAVAAAVVGAVECHLAVDDAPRLRRRVRQQLARISPDLLRQRAVRARAESGLRRWVEEPGVDTWFGTFPAEEACTAWAAVDALAQRYTTDGTCARIDRARAKALTDLVTGSATVDVRVQVVTADHTSGPDAAPAAHAPDPEVTPATSSSEPGLAPAHHSSEPQVVPVATDATARPGDIDTTATRSGRTGTREAHPGGAVEMARGNSTGPGHGDDDLVEVIAPGSSEPQLVARAWIGRAASAAATAEQRPAGRFSGAQAGRPVRYHPSTGALVDTDDALATESYRPGRRLAALVRARDGRCRFPGCHVSARFCDLDHVRPWPAGPTTASNLACLCRRHHRVKQLQGWSALLHLDATLTWTDPTGRVRTTRPPDHRSLAVLPGSGTEGMRSDVPNAEGVSTDEVSRGVTRGAVSVTAGATLPDAQHSALEHHLEHRLAACRVRGSPVTIHTATWHRARAHADDPPPF